eukprot:CAMPEP_0198279920 /NCGR_PEP_ID=MMETSP1449-20131203/120_1 /TAXON_ID=420275 /ORGANISM="Attheya septentrionalis, Strain CCMP2084" /LENGTH=30 /DNA_ID= /DNA_START= /DNA_END= /DNA_ORIENTATION=
MSLTSMSLTSSSPQVMYDFAASDWSALRQT